MAEAESTAAGATDASAAAKTEDATLLGDAAKGDQATVDTAKTDDAKTQEDKAKDAKGEEKQTDKDAKPPEVPEKYDLKVPDGVIVHEGLMGEFTELGKEFKWTNEQAQKVADLHLKAVSEFANQQMQAFQQKVETWANDFKADKELSGNVDIDGKQVTKVDAALADARKVMDAFGTPDEVKALKAELDSSGLGNFRVLIKGLAKFAAYVGEDKMIRGEPKAAGEKTAAKVLYPDNP